ncbi:hypothetical protein OnM2_024111 [Erysiphe neolycopersici]|uniref:Uncharacterized protein n=1 Tax=Erysiphe neolycopersici TaxID=212602 RepID=A0A420I211_9PEZI|nr:hypothetical protein OnM2_024111 [Erysiphe neolycopersici]
MFLNYGAGLHGHEFSGLSNNRNDNFSLRKTPFIRSSLVSSNSMSRRNTVNGSSVKDDIQPSRPLSERKPRDVETTVHFQEPTHDFDSDMTSEGEGSVFISEGVRSQTKKNQRRRKQDPQKSLVFHLAHPAPTLSHTQKLLKIRPKVLLQLQLLSEKTRPKPFIDVLPSSVLIPRLARKFPRLLRGKAELGNNDVIIVKSENYDDNMDNTVETSHMSEDSYLNREIIAVICQVPRDKGASLGVAEIVFSDGSVYEATPLPGGIYEIRSKEEGGNEIVARWWIKRYPKRESNTTQEFAHVNAELKYAFSIIDPNCKRHPTMATITHKQLEILNSYTTLSSSSGRYPPTVTIRDGLKDPAHVEEVAVSERTTRKIDSKMQTLIQVTGIWVSLRQNWCPFFKYNDALAVACTSTNLQPVGRARSSSLTMVSGSTTYLKHSLNSPDPTPNIKKPTNFGVTRRVSLKGRSTNHHSSHSEMPIKLERTISTGSAFIQRTTARRASICATNTTSRNEECEMGKRFSHDFPPEINSISASSRSFTPPHDIFSNSFTTQKRISKEHRRVKSAFYPSPSLLDNFPHMHQARHSSEVGRVLNYQSDIKPRINRWKLITNFFRRLGTLSSRSEQNRYKIHG